jgi:hypothetical protein
MIATFPPGVDPDAEQASWACAYCGHVGAVRIVTLQARAFGSFSLAGAAMKTTAIVPDVPTARCRADLGGCGRPMESVRLLAYLLHAGQVDKQGRPYWEHLAAVEAGVKATGGTVYQRIAALLHDSVEDGRVTFEQLTAIGVPRQALPLIDALTHRPGESRPVYIARVLAEPDALLVKEADLAHNEGRLDGIADVAVRERLRRKYARDRRQIADYAAGGR